MGRLILKKIKSTRGHERRNRENVELNSGGRELNIRKIQLGWLENGNRWEWLNRPAGIRLREEKRRMKMQTTNTRGRQKHEGQTMTRPAITSVLSSSNFRKLEAFEEFTSVRQTVVWRERERDCSSTEVDLSVVYVFSEDWAYREPVENNRTKSRSLRNFTCKGSKEGNSKLQSGR